MLVHRAEQQAPACPGLPPAIPRPAPGLPPACPRPAPGLPMPRRPRGTRRRGRIVNNERSFVTNLSLRSAAPSHCTASPCRRTQGSRCCHATPRPTRPHPGATHPRASYAAPRQAQPHKVTPRFTLPGSYESNKFNNAKSKSLKSQSISFPCAQNTFDTEHQEFTTSCHSNYKRGKVFLACRPQI